MWSFLQLVLTGRRFDLRQPIPASSDLTRVIFCEEIDHSISYCELESAQVQYVIVQADCDPPGAIKGKRE